MYSRGHRVEVLVSDRHAFAGLDRPGDGRVNFFVGTDRVADYAFFGVGGLTDQQAPGCVGIVVARVDQDIREVRHVLEPKHPAVNPLVQLPVALVVPTDGPELDLVLAGRNARLAGHLLEAVLVLQGETQPVAFSEAGPHLIRLNDAVEVPDGEIFSGDHPLDQ